MPDIQTTVLITLVAGGWGMVGGFVYWAIPTRPKGLVNFVKRIGVGFVSGAIAYALGGVMPFNAAGAWAVDNVSKLIAGGFIGLSSIATFLPDSLDENRRKLKEELDRLKGDADAAT